MNDRTDHTPAALYARVSSDRQDVDLSVAAQLRALRDYADKNGYLVAREYVDEAESGRIADRPEFRKMIDEASRPNAPFQEILVWKFSRFTRKREHAVAFKSLLRRKGVRVVSITEHADDSPTGKLMEAIIESVDEFYSENLAQEVTRGMREAASRGFWITSHAPIGYNRVMAQDGPKKRPTLEINPDTSRIVKRIFDMADAGRGTLENHPHPQQRGHLQPQGEALGQGQRPQHPHQRGVHGHVALGSEGQGQGRPGKGGEGVSRHHLQGPVPPRQPATAPPSTQDQQPPKNRKLLPAQRNGQVQGLQHPPQRPVRPERQVRLLRLPVEHQYPQGRLRDSQHQRPPLRGAGRQQDSLQHPHRGQHSRPREGRGRGDGRRGPRAAQEAGDH